MQQNYPKTKYLRMKFGVHLNKNTFCRPRLHGSGKIFARTKTYTVSPCVYTGPAEMDEFLNGQVCKFGT